MAPLSKITLQMAYLSLRFSMRYESQESRSRQLTQACVAERCFLVLFHALFQSNHPKLPTDLSGETFSAVFNTTATAMERLLVEKGMMGPGWLDITNYGRRFYRFVFVVPLSTIWQMRDLESNSFAVEQNMRRKTACRVYRPSSSASSSVGEGACPYVHQQLGGGGFH